MSEWGALPAEMKEMIVQRSTESSRNALKSCSLSSKKLVEDTKLNSIYEMKFAYRKPSTTTKLFHRWIINVSKFKTNFPYPAPDIYTCLDFADCQRKILEILKSKPCIKRLCIYTLNTDVLLKLLPSGFESRLLVEYLEIGVGNGDQIENILSQLEPIYLSEVEICSDGGSHKVYDMQQVILAEALTVNGTSSIREKQLLRLQAKTISIEKISCSVRKYVKRCALEASIRMPQFSFGGLKAYTNLIWMGKPFYKKVALKTDHHQLKLQIERSIVRREFNVKGGIHFVSELTASIFSRQDPSQLRKIKNLLISCRNVHKYDGHRKNKNLPKKLIWLIKVERERHHEYELEYDSFANAQEKIDEIFAYTDYITSLEIQFEDSDEPIKWRAREKKLIVCKLVVIGKFSITSIHKLLQQVDPVFVKHLQLCSSEVDEDMFNQPHVSHASYVDIRGSLLHDNQLLRMKSQNFRSTALFCEYQNWLLTANALNKYMKYCLLDSDDKCHTFSFDRISDYLDETELFEGFTIIKRRRSQLTLRQLITIPGSDFVMHVDYYSNHLEGVRQKRHEPTPTIWYFPNLNAWSMEDVE